MAIEFGLLGEVYAHIDGRPVDLGPARQRCVLAVLLVQIGHPVSADQLAERVWAGPLPNRLRGTVSSYVSRLRQALAATDAVTIERRSGGYALCADPAVVDLHRCRELIAAARASTDEQRALGLFEQALGLWRGEAFAGLDAPWIAGMRESLDAERLAAELDRTDLQLRCGLHGRILPALTTRAAQRPWDERLAAQVMLALSRSGRQADALGHYQQTRQLLAEELGADPGPALRELHQQILTADPALALTPGPMALEPSGAIEVVLTVTDDRVRLHGNGIEATGGHAGVGSGLRNAIAEVRGERARLGPNPAPGAEAHAVALHRAAGLLADSFLPLPISMTLAQLLADATSAHVPLRLGIDTGPYPELPWETLPEPTTHRPLALHPLVTIYRYAPAPPVIRVPAPLRILVAIAAPDEDGGPVLDYERELRDVLAAVHSARRRDAEVRLVEFATTAAIRAELARAPTHILHLSGYGRPGYLLLEDETGAAAEVDAERLVAEAIPPGAMPPVISLAVCCAESAAQACAAAFGAALIARGASVVIGTSVPGRYATALYARIYRELAQHRIPDVVAAVADARRVIHQQWSGSADPAAAASACRDEWSTVTVLAGTGSVALYDPAVAETVPPRDTVAVPGLPNREMGEFVGRRRELRRLPISLAGNRYAGVVLHGIGGIGKTTLAAQVARSQRFATVVPVITGATTVDSCLSAVADAVRRHCLIDAEVPPEPRLLRALQLASNATETWQSRLTVLRTVVFDHVPILVVLDDFEDNLTGTHAVADLQLAALLARWLADPGRSRLLVTSRHPFTLPADAQHRLLFQQVGPLSHAETRKLIWSLPALDRLTDAELARIWRLVGGHPRSLEYLDALLDNQIGRYHDITHRLADAIAKHPAARPALTAPTLDTALAATVTLIADDILLDQLLARLTPDAYRLLIGASVYREPVDDTALLYQIGTDSPGAARQPDYRALREVIVSRCGTAPTAPGFDPATLPWHLRAELAPVIAEYHSRPHPPVATTADLAALIRELACHSLLSVDPDTGLALVPRSTAAALAGSHRHDDALNTAHRRAARYRIWRVAAWPQDSDADLHDRLEARHHYRQAADTTAAHDLTLAICDRLHTLGAWDQESTLIHDTLRHLKSDAPERAHWLLQLGVIAQSRGEWAEAEQQYRRALTIGEELGNRAGMATSYHQLGMIAQLRGDYAEAEYQYLRSLGIKEGLGNRAGMATTYHQLGMIAQLRGDYAEAEYQYLRSLGIKEELGNRAGMATSYGQLGALAQDRGDYAEAELRYRRALTMNEELGDRAGLVAGYGQLGALAQDRGDYAEAEQQYLRALALAQELGYRAGVAGIHHQLGMIAQLRGDRAEARRQYLRALALAEELGFRAGMATTRSSLGSLALADDQWVEATQQYIRAWSLCAEIKLGAAALHNVEVLRGLRDRIGRAPFLAQARRLLGPERAGALSEVLDERS